MSEQNTVKDSTEKAAPTCDQCYEVGIAPGKVAVKLCSTHKAATSLYAALEEILTEAEFVDEARAPFSTWIAGKVRAALAIVDGKPCHDCGNVRLLKEYEKDNLAGTDVLHIEICSDCYKERTK